MTKLYKYVSESPTSSKILSNTNWNSDSEFSHENYEKIGNEKDPLHLSTIQPLDTNLSIALKADLLFANVIDSSETDAFNINKNPEVPSIDEIKPELDQEFMSPEEPDRNTENTTDLASVLKFEVSPVELVDPSTTSNSGPNNKTTRFKKKPDFCYFCQTGVFHFARHLLRHHKNAPEVQKILSFPPKNKQRGMLLTELRKKGNYMVNLDKCVKPMRKAIDSTEDTDYLPCKYCLGYYSSKGIGRHIRQAHGKVGSRMCQTEAQNFLVKHLPVDKHLRNTVFPRMRGDKISLTAKRDFLICKFGSRYLKITRKHHIILVCSRKMRELAKLLLEIQKLHPDIKNLFNALRPEYVDSFVESTKKLARYDPIKGVFGTPTYATNIQSSLKQCCDIAILIARQGQPIGDTSVADQAANLKTFKALLENNWRDEVSNIVTAGPCNNQHYKAKMLSQVRDLKMFQDYLLAESEKAAELLEVDGNNVAAFQDLIETVFCRLLLLNRCSIEEIERLPIHVYQETGSYLDTEDISNTSTPIERILLTRTKRIVLDGSSKRDVSVLVTHDLQQDISELINLRDKFLDSSNIYLFPKLSTNNCIPGLQVLQKHAMQSSMEDPNIISSETLRGRSTTIWQLFNLTSKEIEQVAISAGHTNIREDYKFLDDVDQTAKISNLLMLIETVGDAKAKSTTLKDINCDYISPESVSDIRELANNEELSPSSPQPSTSTIQAHRTEKTRVLVKWTEEQKDIAKAFFAVNIRKSFPPKKGECEKLKELNPRVFDNKTWPQIKVFIQNLYRRHKIWKCTNCDKAYPLQSSLYNHLNQCKREPSFLCTVPCCPYKSNWKGNLERHMKSKHGQEKLASNQSFGMEGVRKLSSFGNS